MNKLAFDETHKILNLARISSLGLDYSYSVRFGTDIGLLKHTIADEVA